MTEPAVPTVPEGQSTPPVVPPPTTDEPPKQVSYETYLKVLDEKKRESAKRKELEEREKARETKELEEKGEYQRLLAQTREELTKKDQELADIRRNETERLKLASILNAVNGEIDRKFFQFIDLSEVAIDPDTGRPDDMSVTKAVEKLKQTYPEFIRPSNAPRLPADAPKGDTPSQIAESEWRKLRNSKEMEKWRGKIKWGE